MAAGQGWPQATCEALDRLTAVCYSCIPEIKISGNQLLSPEIIVHILFFVSLST